MLFEVYSNNRLFFFSVFKGNRISDAYENAHAWLHRDGGGPNERIINNKTQSDGGTRRERETDVIIYPLRAVHDDETCCEKKVSYGREANKSDFYHTHLIIIDVPITLLRRPRCVLEVIDRTSSRAVRR